MVDVRVAEDDRIDLMGMKWEMPVPLPSFLAASLVQATIQQYFVISNFHQVHRASHPASRAPECQRRLGMS